MKLNGITLEQEIERTTRSFQNQHDQRLQSCLATTRKTYEIAAALESIGVKNISGHPGHLRVHLGVFGATDDRPPMGQIEKIVGELHFMRNQGAEDDGEWPIEVDALDDCGCCTLLVTLHADRKVLGIYFELSYHYQVDLPAF